MPAAPKQSPYLNGTYGRLLAVGQIVQVVLIPVVGWLCLQVVEMTGNRFTSSDGLSVWMRIAEIEKTIAALPPDDFRQKVESMQDAIHRIEIEVTKLRK